MSRRAVAVTSVALLAAVVLVPVTAGPAVAASAPSVASQDPSPYATAGCLALEPQPGSLNYLNSEVEPQVAVDPTDPSHLVGVWQQDRWSNGGAHGLVAGYSNDGGATWRVSPQPFSACYHASGFPGDYLNDERASDPWVDRPRRPSGVIGRQHRLFRHAVLQPDPLSRGSERPEKRSRRGHLLRWRRDVVTRPRDHRRPVHLGHPVRPGYQCKNARSFLFNDKQSVTADPVHGGVAYAVWDRLVAPPASPIGFQHERAFFFGPALFSKTTGFG